MKWENIGFDSILGGKTAEGVRYLEIFLQDYAKLFNKQNLNASCTRCIQDYHKQYIKKMNIMDNKCDYVLKLKYIGTRLRPGSSFMVNNSNITNKIGEELLKSKGAFLFEKMPDKKNDSKKELSSEDSTANKKTNPKKRVSRSAVKKS